MSEDVVRDHMTSPVTTIGRGATLLEAALTLRRTGYRHLPIVDGKRLAGIVTDRDVYRCAPSLLSKVTPEEYNAIFENTPIERVMTRDPITVTSGTPLHEAVSILYSNKLGCLPVVDEGELVGIITLTDMLGLLHDLLTSMPPRSLVKDS